MDCLTLVVPEDTLLDLAFSKPEEELVVSLIWPGHAGDRAVLEELVADGLLLAPFRADFVNEYDVVRLSDGDLLVVWREADGPHDVALVVLFGGPCGELVLSLSILVVEMDDSVSRSHSISLGVWRPSQS